MRSSNITGNSAERGGGIYANDTHVVYDIHVEVTDGTITGNVADEEGGGIQGDEVTVTSSTISNNAAGGNGGGVEVFRSLIVSDSTIAGNSSGGDGGGIDGGSNGATTVAFSTISGNSAGGSGGGILARSSSLRLENSIVAQNRDDGHGTDVASSRLIATSSLIGDNTGTGLSTESWTRKTLTSWGLTGYKTCPARKSRTHECHERRSLRTLLRPA